MEFLFASLFSTLWMAATPAHLTTLGERTQYRETGRLDEVLRLCDAYAREWPHQVRCSRFGETPEHRPMPYLVVTRTGALSPQQARARHLPVVFFQAGIHAGEIDGKEAGFVALRQLLDNTLVPGALEKLVVVFVPVFNVDGHEHRGRFQRPNQDGPVEQGARTTAQRINLNRDYMVASAPEMQAMLTLLEAWDPLLLVDLHVTDGARFQHEVAVVTEPEVYGDAALARGARGLRDAVVGELAAQGHKPINFYPRLMDINNPGLGLVTDVDSPRHSHAYWGMRNRLGALVEQHSWRPFPARVETCRLTIAAFVRQVADHARDLQAAVAAADAAGPKLAGTRVSLAFDTVTEGPGAHAHPLDFLGYAFDVLEHAPVTNGPGLAYHPDVPQTWHVPFYDAVEPVAGTTVELPRGGYLVPAAHALEVEKRLRWHGLQYRVLKRGIPAITVEAQRIHPDHVAFDVASFQNRLLVDVRGEWKPEVVELPPGSLFVPVAQPRALLVAHLLEPQAPDSLGAWGLFNTAYEQSDWMTEYRALELTRWMFDGDPRIRDLYGEELFGRLPSLRRRFEERLATDPAFAADPRARQDYWVEQLPPHDADLNRYPVFRTAWPDPEHPPH